MRCSFLAVGLLLLVLSGVQAGAEARKVPFSPRPHHLGERLSTVTSYKGVKPNNVQCGGHCDSKPDSYWTCDDGESCGINCAANPPYGYCY